jgi:hypothetical protein
MGWRSGASPRPAVYKLSPQLAVRSLINLRGSAVFGRGRARIIDGIFGTCLKNTHGDERSRSCKTFQKTTFLPSNSKIAVILATV